MLINKNSLRVDHEYQREKLVVQKVRDIQSNWSWAGCGCILVAMRKDGSFWVFDGQHRVMAARNRSDIINLPCLVFEVESKMQEAAGFLVSNTLRKPVTAIAKFKAMVMSGDRNAVAVDSLLKRLGMNVTENPFSSREVKCVANMLKHAAVSMDVLEVALRAAKSLDGDEPVHRDMLDGLVWIERKHGCVADPRFTKRLASMSRHEIVLAIQRFGIAEGHRGDRVSGMAILHSVNKGLRHKFGDNND